MAREEQHKLLTHILHFKYLTVLYADKLPLIGEVPNRIFDLFSLLLFTLVKFLHHPFPVEIADRADSW